MIRTYFLDVTKKYQVNRDKPDAKAIALAKSRKTDHDVVIEQKDLFIDQEKLNKLRSLSDQELKIISKEKGSKFTLNYLTQFFLHLPNLENLRNQ